MTVINLATSPSPTRSNSEQQPIKRKRSKRRKETSLEQPSRPVPIDRRKRRRNSTHQAPNDIENGPDQPQNTSQRSSSPSELVKSLPINSLIKYLDLHDLLKSPIQSAPSSPPSAARPSKSNDRLTDEFNQFALLVSRHHDNLAYINSSKSKLDHNLSHLSLPHHQKSLKLIPETEESLPISPSISANPSSSLSSSSNGPFPTSPPSLTPFYERLFKSTLAIDSQEDVHRPSHHLTKKQYVNPSECRIPRIKSLNEFDHTIIQLVSNHHHQSFPSVVLSSSSTSESSCSSNLVPTAKPPCSNVMNRLKSSNNHNQFSVDSPPTHSSSSSSTPNKPAPEDQTHRNEPPTTAESAVVESSTVPNNDHCHDYPPHQSESTTSVLDHHGFLFKINLEDHHPTTTATPHHQRPTDHVQIIEDHVLSNFIYSIKTRGNALRPN